MVDFEGYFLGGIGIRCVGVIQFVFHAVDEIHTRKLVLHKQIYDEASTKFGLKIVPPLI